MHHGITGVSETALTVAAARAIASSDPRLELRDDFAASFVTSSGHTDLPLRIEEADPDSREFWMRIAGYINARSLAFDRELLGAAADGIRQIVLVAAGLDARAYRLDWPDGTTIYEIDRGPVLDFKALVLADRAPTAERLALSTDLADDWTSELRAAGFDAAAPTAWLVEGLLPYLPPDLESSVIRHIAELSAPGSRLALEFFSIAVDAAESAPRATHIAELLDPSPRPDSAAWLGGTGWRPRSTSPAEGIDWVFAELPRGEEHGGGA